MSDGDEIVRAEYFLAPGHIYVGLEPAVVWLVLGSCVAVSLWERDLRFGGMCHYAYPVCRDRARATAYYGNAALPELIRMMLAEGAKVTSIEAQIMGGAHPKDYRGEDTGMENVKIAQKILERMGINVISRDVGGIQGRKIIFDTDTGNVAIIKVPKIRKDDWYPDPDGLSRC